MKILYIDESGDTASFEQGGKKIFVLVGCVIDESDKRDIEMQFRVIKKKYYQKEDVEIKSNFLRYANPKIADPEKMSPIKLYDQEQYDELQSDIQSFLKVIPVSVISVVMDKRGFWSLYPSRNPYHGAYVLLLARFRKYLEVTNSLGICIIDPREGRVVDKKFLDKELDEIHTRIQWRDDGFANTRIIEKALFSDSALTVGIQIADLYSYPIFNVFEYDKKEGEYEWFDNITYPKLCRAEGDGLIFFPPKTKKDFRFFA